MRGLIGAHPGYTLYGRILRDAIHWKEMLDETRIGGVSCKWKFKYTQWIVLTNNKFKQIDHFVVMFGTNISTDLVHVETSNFLHFRITPKMMEVLHENFLLWTTYHQCLQSENNALILWKKLRNHYEIKFLIFAWHSINKFKKTSFRHTHLPKEENRKEKKNYNPSIVHPHMSIVIAELLTYFLFRGYQE